MAEDILEEDILDTMPDSMGSSTTTLNRSDDTSMLQRLINPKKWPFRVSALIFMCLLGFGGNFCYDNPGAMVDNFTIDMRMTTSKFTLLYSIYSWPNVILCFVGGFLLDRVFGVRWGTIIYMTITTFGQLLFALGAYVNSFWMMMLGRFIFGIGGESLCVAQNSYAALWFKGKELNMVFGLLTAFAGVGATVNFLVMENVYVYVSKVLHYTGPQCLGVALFLATIACVISMICALLLGCMDSYAEKVVRRNGEAAKSDTIRLSDVKDFKIVFWLVCWTCVSYFIAVYPFVSLGKLYFIRKYEYEPAVANTINSIVYSVCAVASPFLGVIVDRTGRNLLWLIVSIIGSLLAHGLLAFSYVSPYVSLIILGFCYSMLASSFCPLISLVIPEHQLGTAYGISQAFQNLGLAITSIICGIIVDKLGYFMLELFFLGWVWISLVTVVIIMIIDLITTGGYLNMTVKQREQFKENPYIPEDTGREELLSDE